jgi:hypothetical protein
VTSAPSQNPVSNLASSAGKATGAAAGAVEDGIVEASKSVTAVAAGASKEVARPSAAHEGLATLQGDRGTSAAAARTGTRAGGDDVLTSGAATRKRVARGPPPSVRPARAAPLRLLLAYVWPAVALRQGGKSFAGDGVPPLTVAGVARLLVMGAIRASGVFARTRRPTATGLAPPAETSRAAPNGSFVPGGNEITSFVVFSFAVLFAFLISTVWLEVRSKYLYR